MQWCHEFCFLLNITHESLTAVPLPQNRLWNSWKVPANSIHSVRLFSSRNMFFVGSKRPQTVARLLRWLNRILIQDMLSMASGIRKLLEEQICAGSVSESGESLLCFIIIIGLFFNFFFFTCSHSWNIFAKVPNSFLKGSQDSLALNYRKSRTVQLKINWIIISGPCKPTMEIIKNELDCLVRANLVCRHGTFFLFHAEQCAFVCVAAYACVFSQEDKSWVMNTWVCLCPSAEWLPWRGEKWISAAEWSSRVLFNDSCWFEP